jgi:hypothetical protein
MASRKAVSVAPIHIFIVAPQPRVSTVVYRNSRSAQLRRPPCADECITDPVNVAWKDSKEVPKP